MEQELAKIDEVTDEISLIQQIAHFHNLGVSSAFGLYVSQDNKNSEEQIITLMQGGLSLPDRDYYLLDDDRNVVGLLFAGSPRATLINPIHKVLALLNVELVVSPQAGDTP